MRLQSALPLLAVLTALLAIPFWAGWLAAGRGGFLVFLLATALLLCLSWRLVSGYGDDMRWDIRTIDTATVSLAIIVLFGLLLGTIGILNLHVLMLALASVSIAFHYVGVRLNPFQLIPRSGRADPLMCHPERSPFDYAQGRLRGVEGSCLYMKRSGSSLDPSATVRMTTQRRFIDQDRETIEPGGLPPSLSPCDRPTGEVGWSIADMRWPHAVLAGLVLFGIGQLARDRGLLPPVGDAIGYHLPFVGEWLQHGSLVMPVPAAGDPSPPFYPLNSSLWMFWTAAPFQSDVLARFVQAPFYLLLFLAVTRLALEIRIPPAGALTAGLLTLSLPDIIRGLSMAENDVILAALLVAATANLAILRRQPGVWRAAMTAALLGMAVGTKVLAVPFAAVLGIVWLAIIVHHWRPESWRVVLKMALLGAGIVVLLGSYSYLRNWIVMDNPSYPVRTEFRGEELFPGLYTATREWRETHPFYPFEWSGFFGFGMRGFFGWTVPLLILPGMALTVVRGLRERQVLPLLLLAWCGVSLAIFWFVIPYHFERFLYATLAWAIVAAVWGWLALLPNREWLLAIPAIPLALVNVSSLPIETGVWRNPTYVLGAIAIVTATAVTLLMARRFRDMATPPRLSLAVTGLALLLVLAWPAYADRYETQRFDQWGRLSAFLGSQPETWLWLWETTRDDPATIAVAGTNSTFPLYGPTLENRVVTISRDGHLQEYGWGTPSRPFGPPDREQWLQTIRETDVDYVWITANVSFGGWPDEDAWAAEAGFEAVVHEDDLHVWRVSR